MPASLATSGVPGIAAAALATAALAAATSAATTTFAASAATPATTTSTSATLGDSDLDGGCIGQDCGAGREECAARQVKLAFVNFALVSHFPLQESDAVLARLSLVTQSEDAASAFYYGCDCRECMLLDRTTPMCGFARLIVFAGIGVSCQ